MTTEQIIPISEYLLVGVDNNTEKSDSIILNVATPENRGIVKAIGDKVNIDKESTQISVGDKIIFSPGAGIRVTNSDDSDLLLSVKQVIGLIKEGE